MTRIRNTVRKLRSMELQRIRYAEQNWNKTTIYMTRKHVDMWEESTNGLITVPTVKFVANRVKATRKEFGKFYDSSGNETNPHKATWIVPKAKHEPVYILTNTGQWRNRGF